MRFLSFFSKTKKSPSPSPPRRNISTVVRAKIGAARWANRARKAIASRGRPTASSPSRRNVMQSPSSPRRTRNNSVMVMYNGKIMSYNNMLRAKEANRIKRQGFSAAQARSIVNRYGVANRPSNRQGGMWN